MDFKICVCYTDRERSVTTSLLMSLHAEQMYVKPVNVHTLSGWETTSTASIRKSKFRNIWMKEKERL